MSIEGDCVAYLERLADAATVLTAAELGGFFGHRARQARRRVDLLGAAGLVERVHGRGVRANALGRIAGRR